MTRWLYRKVGVFRRIQEILLAISEIEFPAPAAKALAQIARQAGSHLARLNKRTRRDTLIGTNVFIGHGRAFASARS